MIRSKESYFLCPTFVQWRTLHFFQPDTLFAINSLIINGNLATLFLAMTGIEDYSEIGLPCCPVAPCPLVTVPLGTETVPGSCAAPGVIPGRGLPPEV